MKAMTRSLGALLAALILIAAFPMAVSASGVGFGVTPIIPDNQYGSVSTYFDLLVEPGQQQDLSVTVTNTSDEDIVVAVEANAASTNRNGVVIYNDPEARIDDSAPFNFADAISVPQSGWTIPPGESVDVTATLTVPNTEFDGLVLGGIQVLKELTEEELNSGSMIVNQYSYTIGVQLRMNNNPVEPDFALGNVQGELTNYRASIVADIHLTSAMIARDVVASAWIYPKGGSETVMQMVQDGINFSPNAIFPFSLVDEAGYGVEAGDYLAVIQISYDDKSWEFEQEFTIEEEEAAQMNAAAVNQQTDTRQGGTAGGSGSLPTWAIIAIAVGGTLVIVAIILVVVMMRQSKKREEALYRQFGFDVNGVPQAPQAGAVPTAPPAAQAPQTYAAPTAPVEAAPQAPATPPVTPAAAPAEAPPVAPPPSNPTPTEPTPPANPQAGYTPPDQNHPGQ